MFSGFGLLWLVVIILIGFTIFHFSHYSSYTVIGENLLKEGAFDRSVECTQKKCPGASIRVGKDESFEIYLESTIGEEIISVRQSLPIDQAYQIVKFSAKFKADSILRGAESWQTAHLAVVATDKSGKKIFGDPHFLARRTGTSNWEKHTKIIYLKNTASGITFEVQLSKVRGALWVKDIMLVPVEKKSGYRIYWLLTVIAWSAVCIWIVVGYCRNYGFVKRHILIIIFLLIATIGGLLPQKIISSLIFNAAGDPSFANKLGVNPIYLYAHFWIFGLISFFFCKGKLSKKIIILKVSLLFTLALSIETIQLLIDDRNAEFVDMLADSAGIITGMLLSSLYCFVLRVIKSYAKQ